MINLCQKTIGIDIGGSSVKAVCLNDQGVVDSYGIEDLVYGATETDVILAIKKIIGRNCQNCSCVVGLRGLDVLTKMMVVQADSPDELAQKVKLATQEILPVNLSEVEISWQVISRDNSQVRVNVIAVPLEVIKRYTRLIEGIGINLKAMEINALAVQRTFKNEFKDKTLLVDVHADETDLEFFVDGGLLVDKTVPIGGQKITQALAVNKNIDMIAAEKWKRQTQAVDAKIFDGVYKPVADRMLAEVAKTIALIKLEFGFEPDEILLTGGDLNTSALAEYLIDNLIGNYPTRIVIPEAVAKSDNINQEAGDRLRLANAIGLALKSVNS